MSAFNIMINEDQRKIILDALKAHYSSSNREERELLAAMFAELPGLENTYVDSVDGKTKRMLHGFCL